MTILFVGRSTLDICYVCEEFPAEDTKISAQRFFWQAGGPALNAAITCNALGSESVLWSGFGVSRFAAAACAELKAYGVHYCDFAHSEDYEMPLSSAQSTGYEIPVSCVVIVPKNASRTIYGPDCQQTVAQADDVMLATTGPRMVLIDGHLPELAEPAARWARAHDIPVVLDGGSWKPWTDKLLPHVDTAIVSARFYPPGASAPADVLSALHEAGVERAAVTRGEAPILWSTSDGSSGEIAPPVVDAVDTLAAGDIFHGAFCFHFDRSRSFPDSLRGAAEVAAEASRYWGAREWIKQRAS